MNRLPPGTIFAGEFRVTRLVSEGPFGALYSALQIPTGMEVALEVLPRELAWNPEVQRRVAEEAATGTRLVGDRTLRVFKAGFDASTQMPWFATEMPWPSAQEVVPPIQRPPFAVPFPPAPRPEPVMGMVSGPPWAILGIGGALAFLVLVGGIVFGMLYLRLHRPREADRPTETANEAQVDCPIPVSSADPVWGSPTAPVTLVEFADFQCPYCAKVQPTLERIRNKYGDKVRIVWKNYPLSTHPNAQSAAIAAMSVYGLGGADAFFAFHRAAFADPETVGPDKFEGWAKLAGVSVERFRETIASEAVRRKVDADLALAKRVGVKGTPCFFVNGVRVAGAQPLDKFVVLIDEQLEKASAAIDAGTPADQLYARMTTKNYAEPSDEGEKPAEKEKAKDKPPPDTTTVWQIPADSGPSRGPRMALVTIVEFGDFECPYCAKAEKTLSAIRAIYGDKVRLVWKNNPLSSHPRAKAAGQLALEALAAKGENGFWAAHDLLFENQKRLGDEQLLAYAIKLGLPPSRVQSALGSNRHAAAIEADQFLADDFRVGGTPEFFVNGRRLVGAQPEDDFKRIIDEELRRAEGLLASGTPIRHLYRELLRTGKGPASLARKAVDAPGATAPWKGGARARVVIQEFADFECPFCKRSTDEVLTRVQADYGDRIKIVWRNLPLSMHKDAHLAAEAAQEAFAQGGNQRFWAYHDLLFRNQTTPEGLSRRSLESYAEQIQLDLARFRAALDGNTHAPELAGDLGAAERAGITATPAFVIGPYFVSGAEPYPKFKRIIDKALAELGR